MRNNYGYDYLVWSSILNVFSCVSSSQRTFTLRISFPLTFMTWEYNILSGLMSQVRYSLIWTLSWSKHYPPYYMSGTCNVLPYLWLVKHLVHVFLVWWHDNLLRNWTGAPINLIPLDELPSQLSRLIALPMLVVEVL